MATKAQWEIFRFLFEHEDRRYENLNDKGKVYISIIALYLGAIAFKVDLWLPYVTQDRVAGAFFIAALVAFIVALFTTVAAMGIYPYERMSDPEAIVEHFGEQPPADEAFFDDRIIDAACATNRNAVNNNRRATLLFWASALIGTGILCHAVTIIQILRKG